VGRVLFVWAGQCFVVWDWFVSGGACLSMLVVGLLGVVVCWFWLFWLGEFIWGGGVVSVRWCCVGGWVAFAGVGYVQWVVELGW